MWPPDSEASFRLEVDGDAWDVPWGSCDEFGSAAYWIDQTIVGGYGETYPTMDLPTAVVFGLLHGCPVKAETANAYLDPVMELVNRDPGAGVADIQAVLSTPIGGGRYRFPARAASFIAAAIERLHRETPPDDPMSLRRYLMDYAGVGSKVASLILCYATGGQAAVHVGDTWLRRALTATGIFRGDWRTSTDYWRFEEAFLQYARLGGVSPCALDWCVWDLASGRSSA